jgi:hypothetical protein
MSNMTKEQIRILAGIAPMPPKNKMPPSIMETAKPEPTKKQTVTEKYTDGNQFDADMDKISGYLIHALTILKSENMKLHVKETDDNYMTKAVHHRDLAIGAVRQALDEVTKFYDYMAHEAK